LAFASSTPGRASTLAMLGRFLSTGSLFLAAAIALVRHGKCSFSARMGAPSPQGYFPATIMPI
jgi:hypothetical protein